MKKITLLVLAIFIFFVSFCYADSAKGYYRKNGTYVASYQRSSPNNTGQQQQGNNSNKTVDSSC